MSKWNDGGYRSRKFWFAVGIALLMTAGAVASGFMPTIAVVYAQFVSGLLGIAALLFTGNIAAKYVAGKAPQSIVDSTTTQTTTTAISTTPAPVPPAPPPL